MLVAQLEEGRAEVENQYARSVPREGNLPAQKLIGDVFEVCDRKWRGIGNIPQSGLRLRDGVCRLRRRAHLRPGDKRRGGAGRVHQRAGAAGLEEAARLPGIRDALHAGETARARRWFPPKAPARPITITGGARNEEACVIPTRARSLRRTNLSHATACGRDDSARTRQRRAGCQRELVRDVFLPAFGNSYPRHSSTTRQ